MGGFRNSAIIPDLRILNLMRRNVMQSQKINYKLDNLKFLLNTSTANLISLCNCISIISTSFLLIMKLTHKMKITMKNFS